MDAVIIMVSCDSAPGVVDLEVMPDVPAQLLAEAIASALQWQGEFDLELFGTGRRLNPQQTLAEANIWDGAHLRLIRSNRSARSQPGQFTAQPALVGMQSQPEPAGAAPAPASPPVSPLIGWRKP